MEKIIRETHKIYNQLNDILFNGELPNDVVILLSGREKCTNREFWILDDVEMYQIDIPIQAFKDGDVEAYLCRVLSNMVRLTCKIDGVKDIVKGCNTEEYTLRCEEVGMVELTPSDELKEKISKVDFDETIFDLKTIKPSVERKSSQRKLQFKYICNTCRKEIKTQIEDLKVQCKDCDEEFILEE